ncbi:MAG: DUF1501 domain-containing protein [Planctomycetota bacterium]
MLNSPLPAALLARRDLLRVGGVALASSLVPSAWLAKAAEQGGRAGRPGRAESVIFLWMAGGVTHLDSFDPKPQAPVEIRGTLGDIATQLPGIRFCETLPCLAQIADRLAVLRNFSHDSDDHLLSQVYTLSGRKVNQNQLFTEPNLGSVVSYLEGPRQGLPAYIAVPGITRPGPPPHNLFVGGWLGSKHVPYCLGGLPEQPDFVVGEKLFDPPARIDESLTPASLALTVDVPLARLTSRAALRDQLDQALRTVESADALVANESRYQDALRLLATPAVRSAFDVSSETDSTRERYGRTKIGGRCLMARRLVEAGARFVMVDYGYDPDYGNIWDNHNADGQNHPPIQQMVKRGYHLAGMDRAFAALISDLEERGRLDSTLVVFITEFGRTPRINARGGRDHWGKAGSLFFAGGGIRAAQVIGETDAQAAAPIGSGYTPADVAASIYHAMGIDHRQVIRDLLDRPRLILDNGRPIPELFG